MMTALHMAAATSFQCPTKIYTDRGMTQKGFTDHHNVSSADACCELCASLRNSTTLPCTAWTYHAHRLQCETAPFATVVFGEDKVSGAFPPAPPPPPPPPYPHPPASKEPNFVLVLQDDMDLYMGGWTPMRQATQLVSARGATAKNWFIHTPVCCPSRGEILSGRYFHNIRRPDSSSGCMHIDEEKVNPVSFASYLSEAGYTSAYFGKHLNNCPSTPPPGYDCPTCRWFAYGGDTAKGPNCSAWLPSGGCKNGGCTDRSTELAMPLPAQPSSAQCRIAVCRYRRRRGLLRLQRWGSDAGREAQP